MAGLPKYQPKKSGALPKFSPRPQPQAQARPGPTPPAGNPPPVVPQYNGDSRSTYDFPGNGQHFFGGGVVEQAPWAVGPVEARAASLPQNNMRTRQGPAPIVPRYLEGTYLQQMAADYAAGRPDWENPNWSFERAPSYDSPPRPTGTAPGGAPWPTGIPPYQPAYLQTPATYDQYGIPQYGGPLVANPYYAGDDYAQRPSYANYAYDQNPNLSRPVKDGAQRGSGKAPASSGKKPGPGPRTPAAATSTGGGSGGGDLGGYDAGGGYGGGGGGGYTPPPWYYGLISWRF